MGQVYKDLPIALKNPLVPWVILKCIRMTFLFLPSYIFARRNLKGYSYPENLFNFFNKIREKNRVEWSEAANRWYLASICNRFRHVYRICRIYRVASERLMRECAGGTGYQRKERRLRGSGEVKARDVRKYKRRVPARALERRARLSLSLSLSVSGSLSLSLSLPGCTLYALQEQQHHRQPQRRQIARKLSSSLVLPLLRSRPVHGDSSLSRSSTARVTACGARLTRALSVNASYLQLLCMLL